MRNGISLPREEQPEIPVGYPEFRVAFRNFVEKAEGKPPPWDMSVKRRYQDELTTSKNGQLQNETYTFEGWQTGEHRPYEKSFAAIVKIGRATGNVTEVDVEALTKAWAARKRPAVPMNQRLATLGGLQPDGSNKPSRRYDTERVPSQDDDLPHLVHVEIPGIMQHIETGQFPVMVHANWGADYNCFEGCHIYQRIAFVRVSFDHCDEVTNSRPRKTDLGGVTVRSVGQDIIFEARDGTRLEGPLPDLVPLLTIKMKTDATLLPTLNITVECPTQAKYMDFVWDSDPADLDAAQKTVIEAFVNKYHPGNKDGFRVIGRAGVRIIEAGEDDEP